MIARFKPKSEFSKNVLTLMTGTMVAQAIPIGITPVLTRIYTPKDFGVLALFISIASILGSISNARYELAIMLPPEDEDAIGLAALGMFIATAFALVILIIVFIFNSQISHLLGNSEIGLWLYFIPFTVWMMGLFNVLNYLNIRKKSYFDIARATVNKAIVMAGVQVLAGLLKAGAGGLILGYIMAQIVANYRLFINVVKKFPIKDITLLKIRKVGFRYITFPKFSIWGILFNKLTYNLTEVLISIVYSISTLGFYSLAQRILGVPSALVGNAIGQVFFQEATLEKQKTGKSEESFLSAIYKLIPISLALFVPLFFYVEEIFAFVFGDEWAIAGIYAAVLIPFLAVQFVVATVSAVDSIMEKQRVYLIFNIVLFAASMLIFLVSKIFEFSFLSYLTFLSLILMGLYLIYGIVLWRMSKNEF